MLKIRNSIIRSGLTVGIIGTLVTGVVPQMAFASEIQNTPQKQGLKTQKPGLAEVVWKSPSKDGFRRNTIVYFLYGANAETVENTSLDNFISVDLILNRNLEVESSYEQKDLDDLKRRFELAISNLTYLDLQSQKPQIESDWIAWTINLESKSN